MGRPKLLLPWGKTTVIGHLVAQWKELGATQIVVVCGKDDAGISSELTRVGLSEEQRIFNPDPERGMFSSIQCAARWTGWTGGLTHFVLSLGDQPHVCSATLKVLLDLGQEEPEKVCQLRQGGHRRHPVLLPRSEFEELARANATDLKAFLEQTKCGTGFCDSDDPALALDLDWPEDYERALGLYAPK